MANHFAQSHATPKEGKSIFKKIFDVLFYAVIAIVVVFALLMTVMSLSSKGEQGLSEIFGFYIQTVESESMTGTFEKGDVIISKKVDTDSLKEGDIISFHYVVQNQPVVVTHRIINIKTNEIGVKYFITQGDAEGIIMYEEVLPNDVIAKYTGKKITGFGKVANFVKSKTGFLICVVVPLFLFLFWQLYSFIKTLIDIKQVNYKDEVNNQAKALAAEMLKQMQEQNMVANAPPAEATEIPVTLENTESTESTDINI
ncbi:MAG: signal peptidase I [Clostridia bacterium]|nr:signal peptidase I [Clostridia bacterium]